MSYCDDCIHSEVCGLEATWDEALTFCADKIPKAVPIEVLDEIISEISKLKGTFPNEYYLKIIDKYREENK